MNAPERPRSSVPPWHQYAPPLQVQAEEADVCGNREVIRHDFPISLCIDPEGWLGLDRIVPSAPAAL
jgi:hypothetical protein